MYNIIICKCIIFMITLYPIGKKMMLIKYGIHFGSSWIFPSFKGKGN